MTDRLAALGQRIADLESEFAGLVTICTVLLRTVGDQMDFEPEELSKIFADVHSRWPEVTIEQIEKITHGLLLLYASPSHRPHEMR